MDSSKDTPQYRWPALPARYRLALQEAVRFIARRFDPLGILVCGSVIQQHPDRASDLDIHVIHALPVRQRIQKFFNRVPAEIFVNPPAAIERYFEAEKERGRPCTAHMFSTGFVVLNRHPSVTQLRRRARRALKTPPNPSAARLTELRYAAADRYENALDIAEANPAGASLILTLAVYQMLHFCFWKSNLYLPRDKDLLPAVADL
ncbi:MAG: hypothetical protein ACE5G8_03465, partial [Anaerolineae bacterium]